jgi:hypothetical protein
VAVSLRASGLAAALLGAAASIALLLRAGSTAPRVLIALFALWLLSPFAVLLIADRLSRRWSTATRATLHSLMLVIGLASPAMYAVAAFGPARNRPAPIFVVVPPASWLLAAVVLPTAARLSRRAGADPGR